MKTSWIIFGAGNLIRDLQDAILAKGHTLKCVVINQGLTPEVSEKIASPIITLEAFKAKTTFADHYLLGFLNPNKEQLLNELQSLEIKRTSFGNLIHPKSYLASDVSLGYGNYFGPMSVVAPNVRVGDFNYINRCASIGHDTKIGAFNHFGPNATICGNCSIGDKNYFGASSTLLDGKAIKNEITIGAAGLVRENLVEAGTYVGVPVRRLTKG